jgi:DNA recombination-dependent growth factor C
MDGLIFSVLIMTGKQIAQVFFKFDDQITFYLKSKLNIQLLVAFAA